MLSKQFEYFLALAGQHLRKLESHGNDTGIIILLNFFFFIQWDSGNLQHAHFPAQVTVDPHSV